MRFNDQKIEHVTVFDISTGDKALSQHFNLSEFRCKDDKVTNNIVLVHHVLVELLEAIRAEVARRLKIDEVFITITSAYRTEAYNKRIDGSLHSQHCKGMAADIKVYRRTARTKTKIDPDLVADVAIRLGAGGVGKYNSFTHVDVYSHGRRWNG